VRRFVRLRLGIVVTLSALTACAPAPDRARFTVDYYRTHAQVRNSTVAQCANDPASLSQTPDCVNALEAARIEGVGSLKTLPPMGLPTDDRRH
jgi:hypothetical protein